MAEEHLLARIAQSSPRSSRSSRSSVLYSGRQMPLVELAFQGDDFGRDRLSSRSQSQHEDEYVASSTGRVATGDSIQAPLSRTATSWHAGTGNVASYGSSQSLGLADESAIMEASDPALFQAAVEEHARRLGVDPIFDAEFLWIARESLVAPLPDGWHHVTASETGQPYYYNEITGESRWDHPSDDRFRQLFRQQKQKQVKVHTYRDPQTSGYYNTRAAYPSTMAWQENKQDQPMSYAAHNKQGWENRRQADTYYHGYEPQYQTSPEQAYSISEDDEHTNRSIVESESTSISSGKRQNDGEAQFLRKVQEMEQQKTADDETIIAMRTEVASLKRQAASRDEALEGAKSEIEQLSEKLREFKLHVRESAKEREKIVAANLALERELSMVRSGMEGSTKAYEELLEAHHTLTEELPAAIAKLKEVQSKHRGESETAKSLQMELSNEQHVRAQLEQRLELFMKQQSEMTGKFEAAQAMIQRLQDDLSRKHESGQKEDEAREVAAAEAAAMNASSIKQIEDQLADKVKELAAERSRAISLEQDIVQLKASQTTTKEALNQDLKNRLSGSISKADAYQKEVEALKIALASSLAEKVALEKRLEEHKNTSTTRINELEDQQRASERDFRAVERELKTQHVASKERDDELAALKRELKSAETKLATVAQVIQKERLEAYAEAQQASAEIVRLASEEKTRMSELYAQEMMARRKLHNRLMELQGNIRVFCRVRPIQPVELKSEQSALAVFFRENDHESLDLFVGSEAGDKVNQIGQKHAFEFDHVFEPTSTQEQVFEQTRALIISALDGFNVCIFAYGQTGSGKTHTMEGPENDRGVNFRALRELFAIRDDRMAGGNFECSLKLSILEVYNESIVDLLEGNGRSGGMASPAAAKGLDVRVGKNGVYVENLIEVEVFNESDVLDLMRLGHSHRSVGSHDFNEHSSRSHLVLSIVIETGTKPDRRRMSRLHLIDLAGSERVSKTAASGQRLKEAQNINRSLSALGDVIAALGSNSKHVPYRNSKLTFLLQDSLSGNSKVLMFVNVSPVQWNAWETLCSLNFASRCRSVALGQAKAAGIGGSSQSNRMHATTSMSTMVTKSAIS